MNAVSLVIPCLLPHHNRVGNLDTYVIERASFHQRFALPCCLHHGRHEDVVFVQRSFRVTQRQHTCCIACVRTAGETVIEIGAYRQTAVVSLRVVQDERIGQLSCQPPLHFGQCVRAVLLQEVERLLDHVRQRRVGRIYGRLLCFLHPRVLQRKDRFGTRAEPHSFAVNDGLQRNAD